MGAVDAEDRSLWESRVRATFVDRVADLRGTMTIQDLADEAGLAHSTVAAWLSGRREPKLTGLVALASALHLGSLEELLGELPSQAQGPLRRIEVPDTAGEQVAAD